MATGDHRWKTWPRSSAPQAAATASPRPPAPAVLVAGLAAGLVSGMMGIGGGVVLVPIMAGIFGVPQLRAQGTSITVIVPTAIVGVLVYLHSGNVEFNIATPIAIGAVALAIISAQFASKVPVYQLKLLFFAVICFSAVKLAFFS